MHVRCGVAIRESGVVTTLLGIGRLGSRLFSSGFTLNDTVGDSVGDNIGSHHLVSSDVMQGRVDAEIRTRAPRWQDR